MLRISTYCLSDVCFFANTIRTPEGAVSDSLNIIDTNARCAFTRENMLQNESNIRKHTQHNIVTSHVGESHTMTSSVSLRPWLKDFGFTFQNVWNRFQDLLENRIVGSNFRVWWNRFQVCCAENNTSTNFKFLIIWTNVWIAARLQTNDYRMSLIDSKFVCEQRTCVITP